MKNKHIEVDSKIIYRYISEIRKRLIIVLLIFCLGFTIGFVYFKTLLEFFFKVFRFESVNIVVSSPFQVFNLTINTGLFVGLLFCFPVLIYHFYSFIKPALKKKELKSFIPLLLSSLILFIFGFAFGFILMRFVVFEISTIFTGNYIKNYWNVGIFISQILLTSFLLGIIFQFPVFLYSLIKLGFLKLSDLQKKRRYIILGTFIFIALLPPTDPISLILMVMPIIIFFEITLFILGRGKGGELICLEG